MKKKQRTLPSGSILFAKNVVYLVGLAAVAVLVILLPELAREEAVGKPTEPVTLPFFIYAYILATPFFYALYQTLKLLKYIEGNKFFSEKSILALSHIKNSAVVFSVFVIGGATMGITVSKMIDPREDVTFIVPIGIILTLVSLIIAVFVAVLQKLLSDAVALKYENDLII